MTNVLRITLLPCLQRQLQEGCQSVNPSIRQGVPRQSSFPVESYIDRTAQTVRRSSGFADDVMDLHRYKC